MLKQRIALCGFMGCGKTTIGKHLAKYYSTSFYDVDQEIEKHQNMPVYDIFKVYGEDKFRVLEKKTIEKYMVSPQDHVLSLGGGSLSCVSPNIIKKKYIMIFINTSWQIIFNRLKEDTQRPYTHDKKGKLLSLEQLQRKLYPLYIERMTYYEQADISFNINTHINMDMLLSKLHFIIEKHVSN